MDHARSAQRVRLAGRQNLDLRSPIAHHAFVAESGGKPCN